MSLGDDARMWAQWRHWWLSHLDPEYTHLQQKNKKETYFVHQTLYKGALKNWIRHVLYFDTTLDKTGIETLLVDEDD